VKERAADPTEQQDLDLDTLLSAARQTYKEDHPNIRSLEAQLAGLKKQRDDLEKDESSAAAKAGAPKKVPNPQVAQSLENLQLQMAGVKAQIQARNMEMEERAKQLKAVQTEIGAYRARIEASPINEQNTKFGARLQSRQGGLRRKVQEEGDLARPPATWKSARPARTWKPWIPPLCPSRPASPTAC
jgi:DNA-binding protein H-NS